MTLQRLGPSDAAVLETFVVPRYLTLFGEAALDMFLSSGTASIVHLGCRTGYPDELLADRLSAGSIVGLDPSPPAIDLARTKGALIPSVSTDYEVFAGYPTKLAAHSFTHGISLHPSVVLEDRQALMVEMARLIVPKGQVLLSLPMRGSFRRSSICCASILSSTISKSGRATEVRRSRVHGRGSPRSCSSRGSTKSTSTFARSP